MAKKKNMLGILVMMLLFLLISCRDPECSFIVTNNYHIPIVGVHLSRPGVEWTNLNITQNDTVTLKARTGIGSAYYSVSLSDGRIITVDPYITNWVTPQIGIILSEDGTLEIQNLSR